MTGIAGRTLGGILSSRARWPVVPWPRVRRFRVSNWAGAPFAAFKVARRRQLCTQTLPSRFSQSRSPLVPSLRQVARVGEFAAVGNDGTVRFGATNAPRHAQSNTPHRRRLLVEPCRNGRCLRLRLVLAPASDVWRSRRTQALSPASPLHRSGPPQPSPAAAVC